MSQLASCAAKKVLISSNKMIRAVCVLIAGFFIHFTLGFGPTFGNLLPYLVSFVRNESSPANLKYTQATYVYSCQLVGWGLSTIIGGLLERRIGPRLSTLIGGFIMSLGILSSYVAIKFNYWILLASFGLMFGVGGGISFICPVACAVKWFPKWKGLATGIISCGFASGGVVMPFVQTLFVNPHNLKPDIMTGGHSQEKYFFQPELLNRVPYLFLIMGGICALFQFIGSLFLVNPPITNTSNNVTNIEVNNDNSNHYGSTDDSSDSTTPIKDDTHVDKTIIITNNGNTINTESSELVSLQRTSSAEDKELTVVQVLRRPIFYAFWFLFFFAAVSRAFIRALYKAFGLDEVDNDDFFMTIVLVSGSLTGLVARVVWGLIADTTSFKFAFVLQAAIMTSLLATLYATSAVYKVMYLFWMVGINCAIGGYFAIFPVAISKVFGQKNVSVIYGMIFTGQAIGSVLAAFLSHILVDLINWYGVFFILTGFNAISYVIVLCLREKTSYK